jgi:predicted nucleic acid-binding protein
MEKQRVYIDTSVIGGCFDIEFAEWSNKLFDEFVRGKRTAVISDILIDELSKASENIKNKIKEIPEEFLEIVTKNDHIIFLADCYIQNNAISRKYADDALHIASATICKADVLVSWNFKHLVNLRRIKLYNEINKINGYSSIEVRSPREVLNYEN